MPNKKFKHKDLYILIPARQNSKRIKNKNTILIKKKPLIQHSIDFAKKNFSINNIIVSSDSENILKLASSKGIKNLIKRPKIYAKSNSKIFSTINHVFKIYKKKNIKYLILLQPTSPFRSRITLKKALKFFFTTKHNVVTTSLKNKNSLTRVSKDQYINKKEYINGNLYILNLKNFFIHKSILKPKCYFLKIPNRSFKENIDLNWKEDIKKLKLAKII